MLLFSRFLVFVILCLSICRNSARTTSGYNEEKSTPKLNHSEKGFPDDFEHGSATVNSFDQINVTDFTGNFDSHEENNTTAEDREILSEVEGVEEGSIYDNTPSNVRLVRDEYDKGVESFTNNSNHENVTESVLKDKYENIRNTEEKYDNDQEVESITSKPNSENFTEETLQVSDEYAKFVQEEIERMEGDPNKNNQNKENITENSFKKQDENINFPVAGYKREAGESTLRQTKEEITEQVFNKSDEYPALNTSNMVPHLYPMTNKTIIAEPMTSEVQVDDFMKSRVAYHDAILADVNDIDDSFSKTRDPEPVQQDNLSTPEKLTMEENFSEVWRANTNLEVRRPDSVSLNLSDYDLNLNPSGKHFEPIAYRLVMNESDQSEQMELFKTKRDSNNDTLEPLLVTEITTEMSTTLIEETTEISINDSEKDLLTVPHLNTSVGYLEHEVQEFKTEDLSETEDVYKFSNTTEDDGKGISPMAERLFAFGSDQVSKENIIKNELEEHVSPSNEPTLPERFRDYKILSEEDLTEGHNFLPDHVSFKKEKIEPGVLFEECFDCDFRLLPIRPSEQRDAPRMEEESLPPSTIRFPGLPEGRELQIYSLGLSEGFFLFGYLSEFLSWIQPNEFPVELLRDALRSQITWISLITQSLQVEAGFVACLVVGVLLALAVPVVVLSHACYRLGPREDEEADDKVGWAGNCRRRTLVFILQILLILLLGGMVAMFVTNEQLSDAVVKSSDVIQTSLSDVSAFVHNSHLQLHFLVSQSLDQALQAVYADLDNVDTLLGRPIQRELVRETGIDVALESLADLTREAKETTQQVDRLLDEVRVVQEMVIATKEKLSDLRQQVELFRRACGPRDRALCDTIDASGLDVTLRLDRLKNDDRLHRMRRMGGVGLETAASEAKTRFMSVPSRVEADTKDAREEARRQLMRQRSDVDDRSLALERLVRDMTSKVNEAKYQAGFWMQDLDQFEYWRWIVCMGGGAAVLMVWTLLLCSLCCGCCGSEKAAGPTILVTIVLVCLLSTALWSIALVGMLFGGHGEVFVCRPLYDEPEYHVISRLVDQPGVFYSQQRGGFIANVIYGNDTLDVPIRQVLEECRDNKGIYPTLGLGRVFDVEAAVDQHRWSTASMQLRSVRANLSSLEILSPMLQDQLGDLLATLSVNFTEHRIQMSRPVAGKDMDSFARQLDNIGNQMRDLAVASRMETLSTRTRRLIDSHIRPLESRKDALVYQLTALEVQTGPLQRQVNQSLSHLKTIQFFINSQGEAIAHRKSRQYVDRLLSYVDQLRRHVTDAVSGSVAPCRPLWDIFDTTRLFLCRHTMDPLNGYWFASMWCLMVLLVATPVCLKLVDYYRAKGSRSSGSPTENLMISEQGAAWSSPGYDIKYSKEQCNGNEYYKQ